MTDHTEKKCPLRQAIIVEGRYDKHKVSRLFDTMVLDTNGFSIFSDPKKLALFRSLAETRGVIILTDSDGAGFMIRNYLKGALTGDVRHAYIPDIYGRERRKHKHSKEGKLGVEGIADNIIRDAVLSAGTEEKTVGKGPAITKTTLYEDGLYGGENSKEKRAALLERLSLPEHLSVSALCEVLNILYGYEGYQEILNELK